MGLPSQDTPPLRHPHLTPEPGTRSNCVRRPVISSKGNLCMFVQHDVTRLGVLGGECIVLADIVGYLPRNQRVKPLFSSTNSCIPTPVLESLTVRSETSSGTQ